MDFFSLLQLAGGIILAVGYLPQITKILRTKSVNDFNLNTYRMIAIGIAFMEAYAINLVLTTGGAGMAFLLTNTLSLLLSSTMVVMITMYRTEK